MSRQTSHPIFRKTQLCKFYMQGKCDRKRYCKFAHGQEELQPAPDFSFTKMCPDLRATGRCRRGDACHFAHSSQDLRSRICESAKASAALEAALPLPAGPCAAGASRQRLAATPAEDAPAAEGPPAYLQTGEASATPNATRPGRAGPCPAGVLQQSVMACCPQPGETQSIVLALPFGVQAVQVVPLHCVPLPVAPLCNSLGGTGSWADGPGGAQECMAGWPSFDSLDTGSLGDPLDASCGKDLDLELPDNSWSRQSTDEGRCDEQAMELSRQSTPDAWVPAEEQPVFFPQHAVEKWVLAEERGPSEQPARSGGAADGERRRASAGTGGGLKCAVKNTFIELCDQEEPIAPIRRVRSTGDCLSLGL